MRGRAARTAAGTALVAAAACAACSTSAADGAAPTSPRPGLEAGTTSAPPTPSTASTTIATVTTTTTSTPTLAWTTRPIDDALRTRMQSSWREGCPVQLDDLRYVTLNHWGFDGQVHTGELVIHADAVTPLEQAFTALFALRFPIRQMRLVDDFGGDDDASMAADNTSAFNCRPVAGSSRWSQHAYGRAVDVNPVENPYVHRGRVDPPNGSPFTDRDVIRPGMLTAGSPEVAAFTRVGWGWGGAWGSTKDHQHVSATGR